MKKQILTLAALAGMVMGASIAQGYNASAGGSAGGGIVASKHNMNLFMQAQTAGVLDKENRVCAFCHTPHHSIGTDEGKTIVVDSADNTKDIQYNIYTPLWSRALDTTAQYQAYVSATFDPASQKLAYDNLIGPSRLCMTCHDGVVAADAYYGETGTSTIAGDDNLTMFGNGNFAVGGQFELANDHPIGIKYTDFLNKTYGNTQYELNAVTTKFPRGAETPTTATGKAINDVLWSDTTSATANVSDFVTCASCHDVHNGPAVGNTTPVVPGRGYFLYGTQNNSYFCLTCHDKND